MKRWKTIFRFLLLSTLLLVLGSTAAAQTASNLQKTVKPFLKKHCNRCHNAKKQEGNIRVDQLNWDLEDLSSIDELQHLLDEVVVDSMPPDSEPRPSDNELEKFSNAISEHIEKAKDKYRSGGGKPIRC